MADFEQEAFFRLIFDDADIKNKQIALEKRTRENKKAQQELNKEIAGVKVGTPEYDKLIEKSVKLKAEQKLNSKEQADFNRELKNTSQAGKSMKELTKDVGNFKIKATDSYNEAIAKNNLLRQTLKNTKGAFGENSKEVDKLKAALKSNNDTLKQFDATTGTHVRNVGNYEEAISAVLNRLGPFGSIINNIKNDYRTFNNVLVTNKDATDAAAASNTGMTVATKANKAATESATASTEIATVATKQNNTTTAVATTEKNALSVANLNFAKTQFTATAATKGATKGLNYFKIALIGTGIGAIVVVLGSLISAFLSTQRGTDALTKVMRPLGAIFDRVIGLVQDLSFFLVDKLKAAFNDPVGAIKDLGNAILNNVINRFKSIAVLGGGLVKLFTGDWKQGVKELHDGFIQLGTGVTNATDKISEGVKSVGLSIAEAEKIGEEIDKITKDIENAENDLILSRGRLNRAYEESVLITKDQTKSDQERIKAANDAETSLRTLTDAEQSLAKQKIELIKLQQQLNDTDREGVAEKNALIATVEQNEADFNKRLGRILAQRSGLLKKQIENDSIIRYGEIEKIKALSPKILEAEQLNINALALTKEEARKVEAEANEEFRRSELEKEQEFSDGKQAITQSLFNSTKNLLSGLLSAETKSNEDRAKARKEFLKGFLKDTISAVEAFLITQVAKATAGALAQADSIASFGATGVARAAILTGLISAAGAGLRGLVDRFEYGGEVGGKRHSQGGTLYAGEDGNKFEVEKGEKIFVLKRNDHNSINALSNENVRRGGVSFASSINKKFFENGGVVTPLRQPNKVSLSSEQLRVALSIEQFKTAENEFNTVQDAGNF